MKISAQSYLLFLLLCLASCLPSSPIEIRPTVVDDMTPTATELPRSEATAQPMVVPSSLPTVTLPPTTAPTVTPLPVPTEPLLAVLDGCPSFIQELPDDLGFDGHILLHNGSDIWKLFATSPHLQQMGIPDQVSLNQRNIGADGTQLYWIEFPTENDRDGDTVIVYDLLAQTAVRIPPPHMEGHWLQFVGWTEKGQLKYRTKYKEIHGEGIQEAFVLFDPVVGLTETITETLSLPNFSFKNSPFFGRALPDPSGSLVLYTAIDAVGYSFILLDLDRNMMIWQGRATDSVFPLTEWSTDGSSILLAMYNEGYQKFVSLTRDGQAEVLPFQPYPGVRKWGVRYTERSPNQQFIHYSGAYSMLEGPGYMVDTVANEAWEICEPDMIFVEGQWVSGTDQFIYLIRNEQKEYFLRLLDVPGRKIYPLLQTTDDYIGSAVIGWTGAELP